MQFFETEFATITIHNVTHFDETLNQTVYVNQTMDVLRASKLKLNSTYVVSNVYDFYSYIFNNRNLTDTKSYIYFSS